VREPSSLAVTVKRSWPCAVQTPVTEVPHLALQHPGHAASIQRVLAIPHKRTERNLVTYLTEPKVDALLQACDQTT
jgi:hypothetical protein